MNHDVVNNVASPICALELFKGKVFSVSQLDEVLDSINNGQCTIRFPLHCPATQVKQSGHKAGANSEARGSLSTHLSDISSLEPPIFSERFLGLFRTLVVALGD